MSTDGSDEDSSCLTEGDEGSLSGAKARLETLQRSIPSQLPPPELPHAQQRNPRTSAGPIPLANASFFALGGCLRCASREEVKTIAQALEEEWGIAAESRRATVNGKCVSMDTPLAVIFFGIPVRVSSRLRGGECSYPRGIWLFRILASSQVKVPWEAADHKAGRVQTCKNQER